MPADPWFNIWILNQSDATVDQYSLEITNREDLDGNGWTNGEEDSFRLDTVFQSSAFDDQWILVSAPVSDFANVFTGGDGSTVEVGFDLFVLTACGPLVFSPDVPVGLLSFTIDEHRRLVGGRYHHTRPAWRDTLGSIRQRMVSSTSKQGVRFPAISLRSRKRCQKRCQPRYCNFGLFELFRKLHSLAGSTNG